MSKLNIIVATAEGRRFYAALEAAMALAALGRTVRIFLQGEAVALLREPVGYGGDAARTAAGQPELAWMIEEAGAMDVAMAACQTGMALVGMTARDIDAGVKAMGLIAWLADVGPGDEMLVY